MMYKKCFLVDCLALACLATTKGTRDGGGNDQNAQPKDQAFQSGLMTPETLAEALQGGVESIRLI